MAPDTPRVRFAPSPTGYFHVGSARTALFNWLVARQSGGTFVLRIEDTDAERNREEWVDGILSALHWLGMDADEGPYRQSLRTDRYHQAIDALWDAGRLYACGCTHDEVTARNKAAGILTPGYDGHCRDLRPARGEGRALRFRTPDDGTVVVPDVIRGDVEFPCSAMDDFVAVKGSGAPLFVLANVVDDIDMAITHVIRGEDLLPTTPRGILMWEALADIGWTTDGTVGDAGEPTPPLPGLRPPPDAGQRGPQEAVQAQGPGGRRVLPRPGLPARGVRELPRPPRMEPAQRRGGGVHPRPDGVVVRTWPTSTTRRPSSTWPSSPT